MKPTLPKVLAEFTGQLDNRPLTYAVCVQAATLDIAERYIANFYGNHFRVMFLYVHKDNPSRFQFRVQLVSLPTIKPRRLRMLATALAGLERMR